MTAQLRERLFYNGEEFGMAEEPLANYLISNKVSIVPKIMNSSCWRGYFGKWELRDNRLYLFELEIFSDSILKEGLKHLFPKQIEVFASWYSGIIRVPHGELLEYKHFGYSSIYEKDLFLKIENGVLLKSWINDNRSLFQKSKTLVKELLR